MGIIEHMLSERRSADPKWNDLWSGTLNPMISAVTAMSSAGVNVTNDSAMRSSAVMACIRLLAGSIASLPIHLYRRLPGGGKERAVDHWAYDLVHRAPHPLMSAYQWKETLVYHMELTGNHYSQQVTMNSGETSELVPWDPDQTRVEQSSRGGVLRYELTKPDGTKLVKTSPDMLHVPGMAWNGLKGLSPIAYAREIIGLGQAAEQFGARLFGSGTNPGHIFTLPEGIRHKDKEAANKFSEDLLAAHAGLGKSHTGMVVPAGMDFKPAGIPPDDAQFLETRKFQVEEICRIYGIPLHMVQSETKSTSWGTGVESMSRGFVMFTLRPRLCRIEQALNRSLLSDTEQREYFFEFLVDALLRGDQEGRAEFYRALTEVKAIVPNEIRERENMNPVEWGDEPVTIANIHGSQGASTDESGQDGGQKTEEKSACNCNHCAAVATGGEAAARLLPPPHDHCVRAEPDPELDSPRMSIQRSYRRVIRDAMGRVIRRERQDIMAEIPKQMRKKLRRGETRGVGSLKDFIAEFYTAHEEFTREAITPAFTALAEAIGAEAMRELGQAWEWSDELEEWLEVYINAFANRHSNQSRGQLLIMLEELEAEGTTTPDEVAEAFGERFENWEFGLDGGLTRDDKIGARESVRLGNGFAAEAFFAAGVLTLVWRATGEETCPYCMSLNGRSVGPGDAFLSAGQLFQPGGADVPLKPLSMVKHPPAHSGCDCQIVPG